MQQLGFQPTGPIDGLAPESLDDVPRLAEASRVSGAHLRSVGIPPVELGVDQGSDVNTTDRQVLDLAVDVDVDELDAAHHDAAQVDGAEGCGVQVRRADLGPGQVHHLEPGIGQVDLLEPGARHVCVDEVSHSATLTFNADDPRPLRPVSYTHLRAHETDSYLVCR